MMKPKPMFHVGIGGNDPVELLRFYKEALGWQPYEDHGDYTLVGTGTKGAIAFSLRKWNGPGVVPSVFVDDIASTISKICELGGKVVSRNQWGQGEPTALISDPAGNLLDVVEVNVSQQSQLIDMARSEPLFQCPPLNASILNAIMLIAPQFQMLSADEDSRKLWELAQNAACWQEYKTLRPLFDKMPKPSNVLEIGPGFGRSAVFFKNKLDWHDVPFDLYEGEGATTRYTMMGNRMEDSFCGDFLVLERMLTFNQAKNWNIIDGRQNSLSALQNRYGLVYSFYAVGFHWSLEHFFDDVLGLLADDGIGVFLIPEQFEPFPTLDTVSWHRIPMDTVEESERRLGMLVLSKSRDVISQL